MGRGKEGSKHISSTHLSVNSASNFQNSKSRGIHTYNGISDPANFIWKLKVPPKIKILGRLDGRLNTCEMLQWRRPNCCFSPHWCVFCKLNGENANHIFLHCQVASYLQQKLHREARVTWDSSTQISALFVQNLSGFEKGKKAKVLWGCGVLTVFWVLWMDRNRRIFEVYQGVGVEVLWDRV